MARFSRTLFPVITAGLRCGSGWLSATHSVQVQLFPVITAGLRCGAAELDEELAAM